MSHKLPKSGPGYHYAEIIIRYELSRILGARSQEEAAQNALQMGNSASLLTSGSLLSIRHSLAVFGSMTHSSCQV